MYVIAQEKLRPNIPEKVKKWQYIDGDKKIINLVMLTVQEHNNAHAKFELIIFDLVKAGKIIFNRNTNLYELVGF